MIATGVRRSTTPARRAGVLVTLALLAVLLLTLRGDAPARATAYPLHTGIVSTTFWVGEIFNAKASDGSQVCSTYDAQWAYRWGGVDDGTVKRSAPDCGGSIYGSCDGVSTPGDATCKTEKRTAPNYWPTQATPQENPFYLDLPYDDLNNSKAFKARCGIVPWAKTLDPTGAHCTDHAFSYMKNQWVAITGPNGQTCYGQIEDAGPGQYDDEAYVFGTSKPKNKRYGAAGMDVSPALNGCLGFRQLDGDTDRVAWQFVPASAVPPGPWLRVVTTSGVTN